MKTVFIVLLILGTVSAQADILFDSTLHTMRNGSFDRYIYAKGERLDSFIAKFHEYAELASPQSPSAYDVQHGTIDGWGVLKLPPSTSHWMFLNVSYWFLGWGDEDPNYADEVIGLAVSKNPSVPSHVVYASNNYPGPTDSFYGLTSNGVSFVLNVPFDELTKGYRPSFPQIDDKIKLIDFSAPKVEGFNEIQVIFYGGLEQESH
ncbi:MAG: hypothetical protein P1U64_13135 [Alcanivoracaceae bacterium]|nr:hypothetical protein [Alcanivoracaceae bacterium]